MGKILDLVMVGKRPQQVMQIKQFVQELSVVELQFEGDASMEVYKPPTEGLVTKGQAVLAKESWMQGCKIEEDDGDSSTVCPSTASIASVGSSTPTLNSFSSKPKSGRSRTRIAKLKSNIQRLPSPDIF